MHLRQTPRRFTLAVPLLATLAALLLNVALTPLLKFEAPFLFFIGAVMISAWLSGSRGGMLATSYSLLAVTLFFWLSDNFTISITGHVLRLSIFFVEGLLISWLIGSPQRAAHDLERRVEQRTATLQTLNVKLAEQTETLAASQSALRERDLLYRTLMEVFPSGVVITAADGGLRDANPMAAQLMDIKQTATKEWEIDLTGWEMFQADGTKLPAGPFVSARALREQRTIANVELGLVSPVGKTTWLNVTATPLPLTGYGVAIVCSDITDRIAADRRLRQTLSERETMLKEIHHRVKNNLQVIVSLLRLQERQLQDPIATSALRDSRQRVEVMSLVHELLYRAADLTVIDAAAYVKQLSQHLSRLYMICSEQITLETAADPIWLSLDDAVPCGLIVHELLSNSFKYAFPDGQRGTIGVSLRRTLSDAICLCIWDTGVGLAKTVPPPARRTLGTQLVQDLVRQLRGTLSIDGSAGTTITITFTPEQVAAVTNSELTTERVLS